MYVVPASMGGLVETALPACVTISASKSKQRRLRDRRWLARTIYHDAAYIQWWEQEMHNVYTVRKYFEARDNSQVTQTQPYDNTSLNLSDFSKDISIVNIDHNTRDASTNTRDDGDHKDINTDLNDQGKAPKAGTKRKCTFTFVEFWKYARSMYRTTDTSYRIKFRRKKRAITNGDVKYAECKIPRSSPLTLSTLLSTIRRFDGHSIFMLTDKLQQQYEMAIPDKLYQEVLLTLERKHHISIIDNVIWLDQG